MKKLFVNCKVRQLYNVLSITNTTVETKMIYVYELIPAVKAKPVSFCQSHQHGISNHISTLPLTSVWIMLMRREQRVLTQL